MRVGLGKGQENPEKTGALLSQIAGLREDIDVVGYDMADWHYRAAGARSAMLALVEMVYQLRRLSLSKCDCPVTVSVRAQCLAALEDEGSDIDDASIQAARVGTVAPKYRRGCGWSGSAGDSFC